MKLEKRHIPQEELEAVYAALEKGPVRSTLGLITKYGRMKSNAKHIGLYDNGRLIAATRYVFVHKRGYVNMHALVVFEEYQRKGIGQSLLRMIAGEAEELGIGHFRLQAMNKKSKAWYERFGFEFDEKLYTALEIDKLLEKL